MPESPSRKSGCRRFWLNAKSSLHLLPGDPAQPYLWSQWLRQDDLDSLERLSFPRDSVARSRYHRQYSAADNLRTGPDCGGSSCSRFCRTTPEKRREFRGRDNTGRKELSANDVAGRDLGFEIVLVYIGTEDVEINLARIRNRVLAGGHDVPQEDVRRRYARSYKNLPTAIKRADHSILFDNSTDDGYRLVAILGTTGSRWFEEKPSWITFEG